MTAIKSDSNQGIRRDYEAWLTGRLDHLDAGIHEMQRQLAEITAFIDEHKPALARGMALMDPAAKIRAAIKGRKHDG